MDERHTLPNITMRLAELSQNKYSFFDKAYSSAKIRVGLLNGPFSIVQLTPKSQITIGLYAVDLVGLMAYCYFCHVKNFLID